MVEDILSSSGLSKMNEYDAAKKIMVGTITGKYNQKVIALKVVTPAKFEVISTEFLKVLDDVKSKNPELFSKPIEIYKNPTDVFFDSEFEGGLKFCKDPYHLLNTIPLKGLAISVKRRPNTNINPWDIDVNFISLTISLTFSDLIEADHSYKIDSETINALLPLFTESDEVLKPLLKQDLFQ